MLPLAAGWTWINSLAVTLNISDAGELATLQGSILLEKQKVLIHCLRSLFNIVAQVVTISMDLSPF
jgi:hypothetical protein